MHKLLSLSIKLIGIFILFLIYLRTNVNEIFITISKINPSDLFVVYLLLIPYHFICIMKYVFLFKVFSINRPFWKNVKLYFSCFLLGIVTPGKFGEIYRVYKLGKEGHSKTKALYITFLSRYLDICFIIILSVIGSIAFLKYANYFLNKLNVLLIMLVLLLFTNLLVLIHRGKFNYFFKKIFSKLRLDFDFDQFGKVLNTLNTRHLVILCTYTILCWLIVFIQYFLLFRIFGINIGFINVVFVSSITTMASALPITISGIGTRELAIVNTLGIFGIIKEISLAVSLSLYSILLLNVMFGAIFWIIDHKNERQ